MACPNKKEIEKQLQTGVDFSLTDNQYLKSTGLCIPKDEAYLKSKSAISKKAEQYGYKMQLIEKTLIFKKEINRTLKSLYLKCTILVFGKK